MGRCRRARASAGHVRAPSSAQVGRFGALLHRALLAMLLAPFLRKTVCNIAGCVGSLFVVIYTCISLLIPGFGAFLRARR